jgi:hypothetical protein
MNNLYWPVFKNLESEFTALMYVIHIDDNQLNVYSSKIADLVLRTVIEIESISKDLYKVYGGIKTKNIKYDYDCLPHLDEKIFLKYKAVEISSVNCFLTNRVLYPFIVNEQKTTKPGLTYSWNNAYQNIKHDRVNSLKFGSIKYLFDALSALFLLNIYFKNQIFDLDEYGVSTHFPFNQGSEIFSIKLDTGTLGIPTHKPYKQSPNNSSCVYFIKPTEETAKIAQEVIIEFNSKREALVRKHVTDQLNINPNLFDGMSVKDIEHWTIGETIKNNFYQRAISNPTTFQAALKQVKYQAVLINDTNSFTP